MACFFQIIKWGLEVNSEMPKNANLTTGDIDKIENGGGLAKQTEKDRDNIYELFTDWIADEHFITAEIFDIEDSKFEELVWTYFFTLRVDPKVAIKAIIFKL